MAKRLTKKTVAHTLANFRGGLQNFEQLGDLVSEHSHVIGISPFDSNLFE